MTQLFLVNDFNVYQRLLLVFRCCLCDRVDFWPAVFYTVSSVCAASYLKGVVVNFASPGVS